MRVFVASLNHETSSFSPIPTSRKSFEELQYHRPDGGRPDEKCAELNGYRVFVKEGLAAGYEVYASTYAWAQPSAPCKQGDYEQLRDEILNDLAENGDFDMVFFFLHGAQMAQGYADCEGDLLSRARDIVGPNVFIGAELDLHANVSQTMLDSAVMVACKNYPHTDFDDRAKDLFDLGERVVAGEVNPVTHYLRIPMLGMFITTEPKMQQVNSKAQSLEDSDGVLSVSLIHGFRWADIPEVGAGVLVITDGNNEHISEDMRALAQAFYDARMETRNLRKSVDQMLDEILTATERSEQRPFVVADACDNPGGGAGADSTFILQALLERKLTGFALGVFWDPVAAQLCADAGEGAEIRLRLGGKTGPEAGQPLDVLAKVLCVRDDATQFGCGFLAVHGLAVALEIAGNVVIVNSIRNQVFSPSCFSEFGVNINNMTALVVKSSQHFYDQFEPIARKIIYCETPGALSLNIDPTRYQNLPRPIWPLEEISL